MPGESCGHALVSSGSTVNASQRPPLAVLLHQRGRVRAHAEDLHHVVVAQRRHERGLLLQRRCEARMAGSSATCIREHLNRDQLALPHALVDAPVAAPAKVPLRFEIIHVDDLEAVRSAAPCRCSFCTPEAHSNRGQHWIAAESVRCGQRLQERGGRFC
jgi:hypothetical protein